MELTTNRPRRSVKLTVEEKKALKAFLKGKTGFEASMVLKVQREVIHNVVSRGSGSEKTINLIRQNLPK